MLHHLTVPVSAKGQRLDIWLTEALEGSTRSLIQRLIDGGRCVIKPGQSRAGRLLQGGEVVDLEIPEAEPMEAEPEDLPLSILHEDAHVILVNKAPGMVVHPAIGHRRGTMVSALLGKFGTTFAGEAFRPGIVHRLDADTSGVIIVARTDAALRFLQEEFHERRARKRYLAVVAGKPRSDVLRCEEAIGRHPKDFRKRAVRPLGEGDAKEAQTTFLVRHRHDACAVVEARPRTGRTHQIRVHAAHLGHPIAADAVYGRSATFPVNPVAGRPVLTRQGLHAWTLDIAHPAGGTLSVEAPVPADLAPWVPATLRPLTY